MNKSNENYTVTLLEVLKEVSHLLDECSEIADGIETHVGSWLSSERDPKSFPIVHLQNFDLLRQIHQDLAGLLRDGEFGEQVTAATGNINLLPLIDAPKLEKVRNRLLSISPAGEVNGEGNASPDIRHESGRVDLF